MYRRTRYQANFGIDTWYDQLEPYTFKTTQFDLTWDEANALARPERFRTDEDSYVVPFYFYPAVLALIRYEKCFL
jgi:hypothetical protein